MSKPQTQAVQKERAVDPAHTLLAMLNEASGELKRIAPKYVSVEKLLSLALEAKQRNPTLQNCSPMSVLNFCKRCAEWGTDRIGAGGVHPVPFWNSKANSYDMQPIPDWRFVVQRAKDAKAIKHATADVVREKDFFDYSRGTKPELIHKPARGDRGTITEAYCVYTLPDDSKDFVVMDWASEVLAIRDRSKAWQAWLSKKVSCPWVTDEAEMGKKTVVKRTMKLFEGASAELTAMIASDNLVNGYVDIVEEREPIRMPQAIAEASDEPGDGGSPGTADWTKVPIHFGKNNGILLGDLPPNTLKWYQEQWQPKPYKGEISPTDKALRAALDASMGGDAQADAPDDANEGSQSVQSLLAARCVAAGVSFDRCRDYLVEKLNLEDAGAITGFDELPSNVCLTMLRTEALLKELLAQRG